MIMKLMQAAVLVASGLALGGCPMEGAKTAAPVKKAPAADYQAAATPSPPAASTRSICYNAADLATLNARMLQQEFSVVALQCQTPSGGRAYEGQYANFLTKYKGELAANARDLQQLAGRRRLNVDVVVTEFANRTAQKAPVDKEFCARGLRALEWALDPRNSSLAQVPPPYNLGPDMNMHPCAGQ
jgi:hypothetical protein